MLKRLDLRGTGSDDLRRRLPRPANQAEPPVEEVRTLLDEVRRDGDAALRRLTERYDGVWLDELHVPAAEVVAAANALPVRLRSAIEVAKANITAYHETQLRREVEHRNGAITVRELLRPVDRVGCYVPSAEAPLVSTVLMTTIAAKVAGVADVVLATAPQHGGTVSPGILAAAASVGVNEVIRVGGPAVIGALAYGTETIRPVDVIVGPGSARVAQAKREVASQGLVGVPAAFTGPSEVVVVADQSVPPEQAAIDLLVQAEHGPDGLAWLITWDVAVADDVSAAVDTLVPASPRRVQLETTLDDGGYAVLCDGPEQALAVANAIAPEHLELLVENPDALLPLVRHAGAVFCGPMTPASVGDYIAGPNHVLPTYGTARFAEALRVDDFCKHVHVVSVSDLDDVADHVVALAEYEGLPAHAASIRLRQQGDGGRGEREGTTAWATP